ncbi:MAG: flotillin-like protein FloA [Candidatus Wallbacteria bacterium]|nr:flotillin-like protein FloA [Candidatus Wallbacteria bacterium]
MEGIIVGFFFLIVILFSLLAYFPIGLWVSAVSSGVVLSPMRLIGMRLRGIDQAEVIRPLIQGKKGGILLDIDELEAHYLANGHVQLVVNALISAIKAGIRLSFNEAAAIDLAGRNILDAVSMSVTPKVIKTPLISAMAKNGIEVKATARVTVKAKINKLVGGAGEETILARIGEGICSTIGGADKHTDILANPNLISSSIIAKGLDANTAFEIISIDIADIEVGRNIGAQLHMDQAEAEKRIAQAKAEERRAMAVAKTHEMIAYEQEMKARLVEAEGDVPKAIAEALRKGSLGIMDYYRMKNVDADTRMRDAFSRSGDGATDGSPAKMSSSAQRGV